ncbi:hypothetical protein BDR06DRAFT_959056 [Suillus hirtellus]|nr:hypothetical protein BDR06DRAFT_959056 [Suillus hirtellus]
MNPFQSNEHHRERNRIPARRKLRFFTRDKNTALSNPRTSRQGKKHAKQELRPMGRDRETHLPFMTKVKRALGIRNSPRQKGESNRRRKQRSALV